MKTFTKTTKKQDQVIQRLEKKYGSDENLSGLEKDGTYYFAAYSGSGYAVIQRNGKIEAGNIS